MDNRYSKIVAMLAMAVALAITATPARAQLDPQKPAESWAAFIADFQKLANSSDRDKDSKIRANIDAIFDYGTMTDRVIAGVPTEWQALPSADQARFRMAFKQLVQQYIFRFLANCHKNSSITVEDDHSVLRQGGNERCHENTSFKLKPVGKVLVIEDVLIEDLSTVLIYKSQIVNSIKYQKGFDPIIQKMLLAVDRMKAETP